jgi:hypothetical protein
MSRLAIGYSPRADQIDRPTAVFIESSDGVWSYMRGDPAPRVLGAPLPFRNGGNATEIGPGQPEYFDLVLDTFSASCLIRTVTEFEPAIFSSLLTADEIWDVLPRPHLAPEPTPA